MICKYCGRPISGTTCAFCGKSHTLSYTSHELADLFGKVPVPDPAPANEQMDDAYRNGFSAGRKHGYSEGYDTARKDSADKAGHERKLFVLAAAGVLALGILSSIVTGNVEYDKGHRNGVETGKQEQQQADETVIARIRQEAYGQGKADGYTDGQSEGYAQGKSDGYAQALADLPTPSPIPLPMPTPILLRNGSKGDAVRELQRKLILLGYLEKGQDDGDFGPKTEDAVRRYQKDNPTGIADQELWDRIMSQTPAPALTKTPMHTPTPKPTERPTPTSTPAPTPDPVTSPTPDFTDIAETDEKTKDSGDPE